MRMNTFELFFALMRAGLWEQGVKLAPFQPIYFDALYELADEHGYTFIHPFDDPVVATGQGTIAMEGKSPVKPLPERVRVWFS